MTTTASAHDTAAAQHAAPIEAYFEIVTLDGVIYRKDRLAPYGTITTETGAAIDVVVKSYEETGDWIDIGLSKGYTLRLPESRIARVITRTC